VQDPAVWLARAASLAVSLVLSFPLWNGGWLLTGDHAPHIAEVIDLAHGSSGWSDVAYAGFPLGVLHSPFWYGLLAALVRLGAPAWATYALAVTLTECVLGLVALELGRRRAPVGAALLAAVAVQTQSLLVTGPSGVLTGMWTFGLATTMFLVLVDRLHEPFTPRIAAQIAALVGGIGLTHTFAIFAVVAVVTVRCLSLVALGRDERRHVPAIAVACVLGAVASAAYWLSASLSIDTRDIEPVVSIGWPNFQIFFGPWLDDAFDPRAVFAYRTPQLPDLLLWLVGALAFLRLSRLDARERALFATTVGTMILVLFVVSHVAELRNRAAFGPIPWRIMVIARTLLLFLSLAAVPRLRLDRRRALALTAAASVVVVAWSLDRVRWLEMETGSAADPAYAQVEAVFREVRRVAPEIEGRVYVQNTHSVAPPPLGNGHALALLPARAGVRAVGSYYSLVPFPVDRWLTAFVGPIVGEIATESSRPQVEQRLDDLGAEVVVLVDETTADVMRGWPGYVQLARVAPFTIFRRHRPGMARSDDADASVSRFHYEDGEVRFDASSRRAHEVMLAISFAERWELEGAPPEAYVARRRNGLMRVHLPPGEHAIRLRYHEPRWPLVPSALGWCAIALAVWVTHRRGPGARATRAAPPSAQDTALATGKAGH
jgi:hypothetical protein